MFNGIFLDFITIQPLNIKRLAYSVISAEVANVGNTKRNTPPTS
jgi:hypothetical protein